MVTRARGRGTVRERRAGGVQARHRECGLEQRGLLFRRRRAPEPCGLRHARGVLRERDGAVLEPRSAGATAVEAGGRTCGCVRGRAAESGLGGVRYIHWLREDAIGPALCNLFSYGLAYGIGWYIIRTSLS